jgi:eukaryotic-like serine/threonine-protein kinase
MPLVAGSRLDSYEIIAPLGAGGMGEVYRARDPILKRDVAIKVLPAYFSQDPGRLRRFEQEAQATAALNHPSILAIHRFGVFEGSPYLVSELLEGSTLGDMLMRGPLSVRRAIDYGVQIAAGLAAAHEKRIVHRDLKPDNIFLTRDGRAKILDFGLAKLSEPRSAAAAEGATVSVQQRTEPGVVLGTVGYMSPEQVRGSAADHRSDIFACGAILYEMLTGKRAFRKPTSAETMTAILNEDPPSPSQLVPAAPPGLLRIVHRCMEKNPEQRFQSASDLSFALAALSESSSSSLGVADRGSRTRWIWVAGAVALAILVTAFILWWRMPPAVPVVEAITQLTDDGEAKEGAILNDGSRVYFAEGQTRHWKLAQVSIRGGPTALVNTRLADPQPVGMSADGSEMLVFVGGIEEVTSPLWAIPLPAGEPRRVGNIIGQWADFLPDGRVVYSTTEELYIADKDGLNPRRLFSNGHGAWTPVVSPDGRRIAFTTMTDNRLTLVEIAPDGTNFHILLQGACCARWTSDGNYLVYRIRRIGPTDLASDLWALPMQTGIFHRSREPVRLTNGPLAYTSAGTSGDGKYVFAIGTKRRGELVRYDTTAHQLVPFLSGISATDPTFSQDGQWVAYTSYPDHTLWRSRTDGSERMQLTHPPLEAAYPSISPDGTRVAFSTYTAETYVVGLDGGQPQTIVEKDSGNASWSPDGNLLVVTRWAGEPAHERPNSYLQTFDFRTGQLSQIPGSQGMGGAHWTSQDSLVAGNLNSTRLTSFDLKTQKWSDLYAGRLAAWNLSPDRKYVYFVTGDADLKAQRLRVADRQIETIASLKDLRHVVESVEMGGSQINVTPDGSPIFTRDIGTQEIYALTVKWP